MWALPGLGVLAAIALAVWPWPAYDPIYKGKRVSQWIELADAERFVTNTDSAARYTVLEMGSLAVPVLKRMLDDKSHHAIYRKLEALRRHLPRKLRWDEPGSCVVKHDVACGLLSEMGEAARPAVPAMVQCFENCPEQHYIDNWELIQDLSMLGPVAREALPLLIREAKTTNGGYQLAAAAAAFHIGNDTNLLGETFCRLAAQDPKDFFASMERFWFRTNHDLNLRLVPVLAGLLLKENIDDSVRLWVIDDLRSRGPDALPAIPAMLILYIVTDTPKVRVDIVAALPWIFGLSKEPEENQQETADPEIKSAGNGDLFDELH